MTAKSSPSLAERLRAEAEAEAYAEAQGFPRKYDDAATAQGRVQYGTLMRYEIRDYVSEAYEAGAHSRDSEVAALVAALERIEHHLAFFEHVEKRYREAGKDKVAFDKCAEIREATREAREALAAHRERGEA